MAFIIVLLVLVVLLWGLLGYLLWGHLARQNKIISEWEEHTPADIPPELTAREVAVLSSGRRLGEVLAADLVTEGALRWAGTDSPGEVVAEAQGPTAETGGPLREMWVQVRAEGARELWRLLADDFHDRDTERRLQQRGLMLPESVRAKIAANPATQFLRGWYGQWALTGAFVLVAVMAVFIDWPIWLRVLIVVLAWLLYRSAALTWARLTSEQRTTAAGWECVGAERRGHVWPRLGLKPEEYRRRVLMAVALHGLERACERIGVNDIEAAQRQTGLRVTDLVELGKRGWSATRGRR